jgi:hypothetical protein
MLGAILGVCQLALLEASHPGGGIRRSRPESVSFGLAAKRFVEGVQH